MPYGRYARSRSRSLRGRGGGSRRRITWVRGIYSPSGVPVATPVVAFDALPASFIDAGARHGATVTRVKGSIDIEQQQGSGFAAHRFYFGLTVGALSESPDPGSEANSWQWLHWDNVSMENTEGQTIQSGTTSVAFSRRFDVKAQRIIQAPFETLVFSIAKDAVMPQANWLDYRVVLSVLLKLS